MYNPYEINHDLMTILPRVAAQYPGQTSMRKTINTVVKASEVFKTSSHRCRYRHDG